MVHAFCKAALEYPFVSVSLIKIRRERIYKRKSWLEIYDPPQS